MGVSSKQMTFSLACAVVLSAVVPGVTGYLSARVESLEAAERKLHAMEMRLNERSARELRPVSYPVSYPAPCGITPRSPAQAQQPSAAFAPEYKAGKKRSQRLR
ncbi:hypothetical protein [Nonomuraea longicatena]|uniref:Uncharacterized protein n=1 Tax=Nonomuraea longicatena TaxID=83682 RepID=A0ABP4BSK8_9ACTN